MEINYPNQCIVCKSKNKLRCTGCNMVSYCGRDHQLQHWSIHKNFCRTISKMLNEKNLSHIYENLNLSIWLQERDKIIHQVRKKLKSLNSEELFLLKSPRICFICHEAKQEKLNNCPNCQLVNFCNIHKSSYIHERNCSIMQNRFDLITRKMNFDSRALELLIKSIARETKIFHSPPITMREFLDNNTKTINKITEIQKIFLSETFTVSLTIFNILQMHYDNIPMEIIIHLNVNNLQTIFIDNFWETLLHLLLDVKLLKIIYIEGKINHINNNVILCNDCQLKKRQLSIESNSISYEKYINLKNYQKPHLIAYFNIKNPMTTTIETNRGINIINKLNEINCPKLMTFLTEMEFTIMREYLRSSINYSIIYSGYNDFASLMFHHEQNDGSLNRTSQFMIVFKEQRINFPESSQYWSHNNFYSTICHVCRKINAKIICQQCKMIFYCSNKHQNRDWIHHRDICNAIFSFLCEMKIENIFDNAKLLDLNSWLRIRIDLMKEIQMRSGRILEECERQMFFFPKNCAICHDNDLNILNMCKCGTNFCRLHQNDKKHQKLCEKLSIAFQLATIKKETSLKSILSTALDSRHKLPPTMEDFIKKFSKPSEEEEEENSNPNYKDLITSDFLTSSLTLNYAIKKFTQLLNNSSMVIHILNSKKEDLLAKSSWKLLLYRLKNLKILKIIFIGTEIPQWPETIVDTLNFSQIAVKYLKVESHSMKYEKYFKTKQFIKPDIIFSSNVNIHECELDNRLENFWKEIIMTVKKIRVPIILTAKSEKRAIINHKKIWNISNFSYFQQINNPFASLCPERDFETEGIMYSNNFLIIYNDCFHINLDKSLSIKDNERQKEKYLKSRVTNFGNISNFTNSSETINVENKNLKDQNKEIESVVQSTKIVITDVEGIEEKIYEHQKNGIAMEKQIISVSCENLRNQTKLNDSESFLVKHNSFLKSENERLRQQLDLAIAEIAKLENKIVELQKSTN